MFLIHMKNWKLFDFEDCDEFTAIHCYIGAIRQATIHNRRCHEKSFRIKQDAIPTESHRNYRTSVRAHIASKLAKGKRNDI